MMKQLVSVLTCVLLLTLCACGQTGQTTAPENEDTQGTAQDQTQTQEQEAGALVPESEAVSADWFQDAAFVGDSVSVMLETYNGSEGTLGTPDFFCTVSLSQQNAMAFSAGDERLPEYPKGSGQHPKLEDGLAESGAHKIYVMLGMNCIAGGVDRACQDLVTLINKILEQSPEATILVESVTPMTADSPRADEALNNETIAEYNQKVLAVCQERGWYFVNVAEAVSDENGFLRDDFSGDKAMGIHFNYNGARAWADYLLTHVPEALK